MALAADAEGYKYIVWDFNGRFAILSPKPYQLSSFVAKERLGTEACYHSTQRKSCFHQNCRPRTRASVRRASGFVVCWAYSAARRCKSFHPT
jgi:hypothetical protein